MSGAGGVRRGLILLSLLPGAAALSGCAAGVAAGAIGVAAARSGVAAKADPNAIYNDEGIKQTATSICRIEAARYGEVTVIDTEQRGPTKVVVWGTTTIPDRRQSFECHYDRRITSFRLRKT